MTEILILDNASTDLTSDVIRQFSDPRISYLRSEINLGFAGNLQRGFLNARGKFLQFLCADDFLYPGCLEQTAALLNENPDMSFAHSGHDLVDEAGKLLERRIDDWKTTVNSTEFLNHIAEQGLWGICLSSALIRRSDLEAVGGVDTSLGFAADYGMWLSLCLNHHVGYLAKPLTAYRIHSAQATETFVPHLKRNVIEIFLQKSTAAHSVSSSVRRDLKKRALCSALNEMPRRKISGESNREIFTDLRRLLKDYGAMILRRDIFTAFLAFLPRSWVETIRRITHSKPWNNLRLS